MKVLIVTHYWLPHMGGIERVAYEQATRLSKEGNSVYVITSMVGSERAFEEPGDNLTIFRVPAFNFLENGLSIPYPIFSPLLLSKISRIVDNVEVVNCHDFFYMSSFFSALQARKKGIPIVLTQHVSKISYESKCLNFMESLVCEVLGRYVLNSADEIVCVSRKTREYVGRGTVIYNGVDHERFVPAGEKEKEKLRNRYGLPENATIVLYLGRVAKEKKGIDVLLRAIKGISIDDLYFLIVGKGPDEGYVNEFIIKNSIANCNLMGFVPESTLPEIYRLSDIYVLSSKTGEGLPMTVLEALSSGLPVIATRGTGGHEEIIVDFENGFLVDPNDPRELAGKIELLANDDNLLQEMSRNARQIVENWLNWERNIEKLTKVYENVISRKTSQKL